MRPIRPTRTLTRLAGFAAILASAILIQPSPALANNTAVGAIGGDAYPLSNAAQAPATTQPPTTQSSPAASPSASLAPATPQPAGSAATAGGPPTTMAEGEETRDVPVWPIVELVVAVIIIAAVVVVVNRRRSRDRPT
jgi:cobalamin biosynthesis Mg chelatase CobN